MLWLVFAITAAVIWGLTYTLDGKLLSNHFPVLLLLAGQSILGALVFSGLFYFYHPKSLPFFDYFKNNQNLWLFITTIIVTNTASFFIVLSMQAKNSTIAALIELTYPLFTILFTWLLFRELYLNKFTIFGAGLIILGAIIIAAGEK